MNYTWHATVLTCYVQVTSNRYKSVVRALQHFTQFLSRGDDAATGSWVQRVLQNRYQLATSRQDEREAARAGAELEEVLSVVTSLSPYLFYVNTLVTGDAVPTLNAVRNVPLFLGSLFLF